MDTDIHTFRRQEILKVYPNIKNYMDQNGKVNGYHYFYYSFHKYIFL